MGLLDGRVCVITGAGRGIGREHALMMAREGARIVVNDLGGDHDGDRNEAGPAQEVVAARSSAGGEAVANGDDVSDFEGAGAHDEPGHRPLRRLDVLVNNAGILRDRMLVNMDEAEWDAVIKVHLKGTFAPTRHAAAHWREQAKAGETVDARIINTTSASGIYGNVGPDQLRRGQGRHRRASRSSRPASWGATASPSTPSPPRALTRLTEDLGMGQMTEEAKEEMSPRWIAPLVTWLASTESADVTGRVFDVSGRALGVAEGWHLGPTVESADEPSEVGAAVAKLMADARPNADMSGQDEQPPAE